MKEFVENTLNFKVLTPNGYQSFAGVACMGDKPIYRVEFENGNWLEVTSEHKLFQNGLHIPISQLDPDDLVDTYDGPIRITRISETGRVEPVYDLIEVDGGHRYYTNGVLSSNCQFVTEDETLIDNLTLTALQGVDEEFKIGEVRWYQEPRANQIYLAALDPSVGTGGDFAAIQVFEMPSMVQVAEWRHNKTPARGQVGILLDILNYIYYSLLELDEQAGEPEVYWTIENNGVGEGALVVVDETGEEKFPGVFVHEPRRSGGGRGRRGLTTTNRSKITACTKLKSLIESRRMVPKSKALIRELKNYVATGRSFAAKWGETDDLISATLLIVRMSALISEWDPDIGERLRDIANLDSDEGQSLAPLPISF